MCNLTNIKLYKRSYQTDVLPTKIAGRHRTKVPACAYHIPYLQYTTLLTPHELKQHIRRGESQEQDFKLRITHPDKIAKTLSSFANSAGGRLLVGVNDQGSIIGVDPQEELHAISLAAEHYCRPAVPFRYHVVEDSKEDWRVLVVEVAESLQRPHYCTDARGNERVYIRSNDKSLLASSLVIRQLKNTPPTLKERTGPSPRTPHEKALFDYLTKNERITARGLCKLLNISERRARRALIEFTRSGFLYQHEQEKETYYTLS